MLTTCQPHVRPVLQRRVFSGLRHKHKVTFLAHHAYLLVILDKVWFICIQYTSADAYSLVTHTVYSYRYTFLQTQMRRTEERGLLHHSRVLLKAICGALHILSQPQLNLSLTTYHSSDLRLHQTKYVSRDNPFLKYFSLIISDELVLHRIDIANHLMNTG